MVPLLLHQSGQYLTYFLLDNAEKFNDMTSTATFNVNHSNYIGISNDKHQTTQELYGF